MPRARMWLIAALLASIALTVVGLLLSQVPWVRGPTILRAGPSGKVWLLENRRLVELDANGRALRTIDYAQLGISKQIDDFTVTQDGTLFVSDPQAVRRYSEDGSLLGTIELKTLRFGKRPIALDEAGARVLIASQGRVDAYSFEGAFIESVEVAQLRSPLSLALKGRTLMVADSRAGLLRINKGGHAKNIAKTLDTPYIVDPVNRGDGESGGWWALSGNSFSKARIALHRIKESKAQKLVEFGEDANPKGLLARANDVLVTDEETMRIQRFDNRGEAIGALKSESLTALFGKTSEARDRQRTLSAFGAYLPIAGLLGVLISFLLLLRKGEDHMSKVHARMVSGAACAPERLQALGYLKLGLIFLTFLGVFFITTLSFFAENRSVRIGLFLGGALAFGFISVAVRRVLLGTIWSRMADSLLAHHGDELIGHLLEGEQISHYQVVGWPRAGGTLGLLPRLMVATDKRLLLFKQRVLRIRGPAVQLERVYPLESLEHGGAPGLLLRFSDMVEGRKMVSITTESKETLHLFTASAASKDELSQLITRAGAGAVSFPEQSGQGHLSHRGPDLL